MEAELYALRAVKTIDSAGGPEAALLRPLHTLATVRLEQGKIGAARKAYERMQAIHADLPEDRAVVHGLAAAFYELEHRYGEAESEYLETLSALYDGGRARGADYASVLMALGSVYMKLARYENARTTLDRALIMVRSATDTVPMDQIKILKVRAVLDGRMGNWQNARASLQRALSLAGPLTLDPGFYSDLLAEYAQALRRNHQRREARSVQARSDAIRSHRHSKDLVDVTELIRP